VPATKVGVKGLLAQLKTRQGVDDRELSCDYLVS